MRLPFLLHFCRFCVNISEKNGKERKGKKERQGKKKDTLIAVTFTLQTETLS